ncbi:MAG: RNA polymerase sigma factor [Patescibacteria group bacterium]
MERDEFKIINNCRKGNLKEFGKLYDNYIDKIYNFIYYKTFHKETAEDLVSQTFFKALEKINKYSPEIGSFSSWLYQIARNTVIDYYRTKKETNNIEDIWDLKDNTDLERDEGVKQKLEDVQKYLSALNKEQREIVIMRVWDELSYKEIAEITGKSEASLKMTFSRTINKLRQEMPLEILILLLLAPTNNEYITNLLI